MNARSTLMSAHLLSNLCGVVVTFCRKESTLKLTPRTPYKHYEICYFPGDKTIHTLKFDVIKLMAWNLVNDAGFPSDAAYHRAVIA